MTKKKMDPTKPSIQLINRTADLLGDILDFHSLLISPINEHPILRFQFLDAFFKQGEPLVQTG